MLDFPFLRKLSLQNYGFARKIYEASDAALQLKNFYYEIASPLLANVTFNYTSPDYNVTELTVTRFPTVFGGTEVAVAGRLVPLAVSVTPPENEPTEFDEAIDGDESITTTTVSIEVDIENVTTATNTTTNGSPIPRDGNAFVLSDKHFLDIGIYGSGRDGVVNFKPPVIFCQPIDNDILLLPPFPPRPTPPPTPEDQFLERLWAYLTIRQLIEKDLTDDDIKKKAASEDSQFSDSSIDSNATVVSLNGTENPIPEKPLTSKQSAIKLALKV